MTITRDSSKNSRIPQSCSIQLQCCTAWTHASFLLSALVHSNYWSLQCSYTWKAFFRWPPPVLMIVTCIEEEGEEVTTNAFLYSCVLIQLEAIAVAFGFRDLLVWPSNWWVLQLYLPTGTVDKTCSTSGTSLTSRRSEEAMCSRYRASQVQGSQPSQQTSNDLRARLPFVQKRLLRYSLVCRWAMEFSTSSSSVHLFR